MLPFILPALIGAGASLAGGLMENKMARENAETANANAAAEAVKNREWQAEMSNSAYQRGMADMKTAGLNPILAYQKGPASSPTGAAAATSMAPVVPFTSNAVNAANTSRRVSAEVDNMSEQNKNLSEVNKNLQAQNVLTRAQTLQATAQAGKTAAETAVVRQALERGAGEAERGKTLDWWRGTYPGKGSAILGDVIKDLSPWTSSARDVDSIRGRVMHDVSDGPSGTMTRVRVNRSR